jgi:hypothetical protein
MNARQRSRLVALNFRFSALYRKGSQVGPCTVIGIQHRKTHSDAQASPHFFVGFAFPSYSLPRLLCQLSHMHRAKLWTRDFGHPLGDDQALTERIQTKWTSPDVNSCRRGKQVRFSLQNRPENRCEKYCITDALTDIRTFNVQIWDIDRSRKIGRMHGEQIREFDYVKRKLATYS